MQVDLQFVDFRSGFRLAQLVKTQLSLSKQVDSRFDRDFNLFVPGDAS